MNDNEKGERVCVANSLSPLQADDDSCDRAIDLIGRLAEDDVRLVMGYANSP